MAIQMPYIPTSVNVTPMCLEAVRNLYQSTYFGWCSAADGNEGGRHHLITAAVGNGNLYIMKVQIGDKRWFKGARKDAEGAWNSFTVA